MTRRFVHLDLSLKADPRYRALSVFVQHVYLQLHLDPELSAAGTLRVNLPALAAEAPGISIDDINRALEELAAAGLVLKDSETFELWITDFIRRDRGLRNPNWARAAVRAIEALMSHMLATAILETAPEYVTRFAESLDVISGYQANPKPMPSGWQVDAKSIGSRIIVHPDTDTDTDTSALVQAYWQQCPVPDVATDDQTCIRVQERVQEAITQLAERSVADAPAGRDLLSEVQVKRERYVTRLVDLATDFPAWTPRHLANAIDRGRFGE